MTSHLAFYGHREPLARTRLAMAMGVLLLFMGLFVGLVAATQHVAAAYRYHRTLGEPWFRFGRIPVYPAWKFFLWRAHLGEDAPEVFGRGLRQGCDVGGAFLVLAAAVALRASWPSRSGVATFGSSRWATTKELKRAGLLGEDGVVLCQTDDAVLSAVSKGGSTALRMRRPGRLVRHAGVEHVLCFSPTRSGKTAGLVLPSLLSLPEWSVLVWDVKRELWNLSAGWRSTFGRALRFEPTDESSARYNPLLEIRRGVNEVRDAQAVADMLVDPDGAKEKDHWQLTAFTLLTGVILHVLYAEKEKTLASVTRFLSDPERSQFDTLELMLKTNHLRGKPHPVVAECAREVMNKADNEMSGVFSTALAAMGLYRDPLLARATSGSDFRIEDLTRGKRPTSLYLVVAPADLDRLRPLMRLIVNQIGRRLTESAAGAGETPHHRLLMMLDEFPTLGRMRFFENALAYLAGYGIKVFLIAQDLHQLEASYGEKNSIIANCHVRVTYGANDDHTAERISRLLGQGTIEKGTESESFGKGDWLGKKTRTTGSQEHARLLLTAGEVLQLPREDALVFMGGLFPYRGKKVLYYEDPIFRARAALSPPSRAVEEAMQRSGERSCWEEAAL